MSKSTEVWCKQFNNKTFRLNLLKAFECGIIKFNPCDIVKIVKNNDPKIIDAGSSDAIIIIGNPNMKNNPNIPNSLVIKLSFVDKKKYDNIYNQTEIEILIYKHVTNPLILNGSTPHIMLYLASGTCDNFLNSLELQTKENNNIAKNLFKKITEIASKERENFYKKDANVLVLEKGEGKELGQLTTKLSIEQWFVLIYQVLYTLLCFKQVGLAHNDLHLNNVFVETTKQTFTNIYYDNPYNSESYRSITTNIFCRILDFDLSTKQPTSLNNSQFINKKLTDEYCKRAINRKTKKEEDFIQGHGACNFINPKQDTFKFLWSLYETPSVPKIIKQWIKEQINIKLLNLPVCFSGFLCAKIPQKRGGGNECYCKPFYPTDQEMKPLEQILIDFPILSLNMTKSRKQKQIQNFGMMLFLQ